jgi:hypothetical protein
MKPSSDAELDPRARNAPREADSPDVRVSVIGFAALYAAALDLPVDRLQTDPSWCVEQLKSGSLALDLS